MKRLLSREELQAHLDEQIGFLRTSAAAYDRGFEGEAKRLAVTIRVLLHETASSHSLLAQLRRRSGEFWELGFPPAPGSVIAHGSLVAIAMMTNGPPRYVAPLDDVPLKRLVSFEEWWSAPIFEHPDGAMLSRRDLVLATVNQDGGAHVDPALDETYARFARDNAMGWTYPSSAGAQPIHGAAQAAIRQIAHEVLKTLVPGYEKNPEYPPDTSVIMGGASVVRGSAPPIPTVGRNDPCPCGSGRKYKRCHGA